MRVSVSSFSPRIHWGSFLLLAVLVAALGACVMVDPQDRQHLSDPSMTFGDEAAVQGHEAHVVENREGSNGGSASGGGCGCN